MYAVSEVAGGAETCELIDDPDGRLGRVEPLGPGGNGRVQGLDLGVVAAESDGDDLSHLIWILELIAEDTKGLAERKETPMQV